MKISKYLKLIIITILIFTIISNSIFIPKKAEASVAVTLGLLYGVTVGEAVLAFILSSAAIGVTYLTLEEAKKAYDLQEEIDFEELMKMPTFDPRPPGEPEPPGEPPKNWRDQMIKLLKGTGLSGLGLLLLYNLKEWYKGLGVESEGVNNVSEFPGLVEVNEYNGIKYFTTIRYEQNSYFADITILGKTTNLRNVGAEIVDIKIDSIIYSSSLKKYDIDYIVYYMQSGSVRTVSGSSSLAYDLPISDYPDIDIKDITLVVLPNTTVLTDILPNRANDIVYDGDSQGEVIYPGQLSNPTIQPNLDVIPQDRFETNILPNGTTQKRYKGTQEQMLEDIVNNTTIENVYNNNKNYTTINEGEAVIINEGNTTTPYPTPTPGETPTTAVEPGTQLDYTPWFQSIINWLSQIYNKISEDTEQDQEEDTEQDEELEPEEPLLDFSPLQDIGLKTKFPFSLPWDIKASIDLLVAPPQAPHWTVPIVSEEIEIDLAMFESFALISRSFLSIIFIVMLIILTRRFIGGS